MLRLKENQPGDITGMINNYLYREPKTVKLGYTGGVIDNILAYRHGPRAVLSDDCCS